MVMTTAPRASGALPPRPAAAGFWAGWAGLFPATAAASPPMTLIRLRVMSWRGFVVLALVSTRMRLTSTAPGCRPNPASTNLGLGG